MPPELREKIIDGLRHLDVLKYDKSKYNRYDVIESRKYIVEALESHCSGSSYSDLIMDQLLELHSSGSLKIGTNCHPYHLNDIFQGMQMVLKGEKLHKPFRSKKSKLYGKCIYHIHHSPNFEIIPNLIRYMRQHYKSDSAIVDRLSKLKAEHPSRNNHMVMFVYEVLMNSYESTEKTGEWLVFQKEGTQVHFVCLYLHNNADTNDQKFYSFIKNELKWNNTQQPLQITNR